MSVLTDSLTAVKNEALIKANATSTAIHALNRQCDVSMRELRVSPIHSRRPTQAGAAIKGIDPKFAHLSID